MAGGDGVNLGMGRRWRWERRRWRWGWGRAGDLGGGAFGERLRQGGPPSRTRGVPARRRLLPHDWVVVVGRFARSSGVTRAVSSRSRRGRVRRTVPNCAQHTAVSAAGGGVHARPACGGIGTELLTNSVRPAAPSTADGSRRGVGSIGITCRYDNHHSKRRHSGRRPAGGRGWTQHQRAAR